MKQKQKKKYINDIVSRQKVQRYKSTEETKRDKEQTENRKNIQIDINDDAVFPNISCNSRQIDLNVNHGKKYDTTDGNWDYLKTFKRIETYGEQDL